MPTTTSPGAQDFFCSICPVYGQNFCTDEVVKEDMLHATMVMAIFGAVWPFGRYLFIYFVSWAVRYKYRLSGREKEEEEERMLPRSGPPKVVPALPRSEPARVVKRNGFNQDT